VAHAASSAVAASHIAGLEALVPSLLSASPSLSAAPWTLLPQVGALLADLQRATGDGATAATWLPVLTDVALLHVSLSLLAGQFREAKRKMLALAGELDAAGPAASAVAALCRDWAAAASLCAVLHHPDASTLLVTPPPGSGDAAVAGLSPATCNAFAWALSPDSLTPATSASSGDGDGAPGAAAVAVTPTPTTLPAPTALVTSWSFHPAVATESTPVVSHPATHVAARATPSGSGMRMPSTAFGRSMSAGLRVPTAGSATAVLAAAASVLGGLRRTTTAARTSPLDAAALARANTVTVVTCPACYEDVKETHMVVFEPCAHAMCRPCSIKHIRTTLLPGVLSVPCPVCDDSPPPPPPPAADGEPIPGRPVRGRLTEAFFQRLLRWSMRPGVLPPEVRPLTVEDQHRFIAATVATAVLEASGGTDSLERCVNDSCGAWFIVPACSGVAAVACPSCKFATCALCKRPWRLHADGSRTCAEVRALDREAIMEQLFATRQADKYKLCPSCNEAVFKAHQHGCHHVSCVCGTEFCYTCGADLNASYHEAACEQFCDDSCACPTCPICLRGKCGGCAECHHEALTQPPLPPSVPQRARATCVMAGAAGAFSARRALVAAWMKRRRRTRGTWKRMPC